MLWPLSVFLASVPVSNQSLIMPQREAGLLESDSGSCSELSSMIRRFQKRTAQILQSTLTNFLGFKIVATEFVLDFPMMAILSVEPHWQGHTKIKEADGQFEGPIMAPTAFSWFFAVRHPHHAVNWLRGLPFMSFHPSPLIGRERQGHLMGSPPGQSAAEG